MATWLDLKTYVSGQLGADTGATPTALRDKRINEARREFYSYRRWSFLLKSTTLSLTNSVANLPIDYNKKFDPIDVYTYAGSVKTQYMKVAWADVGYFGTDDYVYAVNKQAGTLKTNQAVSTLTIDYTYLPTDKSSSTTADDANEEPAPDITPIGLLAIAKWWLASERGTGKYQLFKDEYKEALANSIVTDAGTIPVKPLFPRTKRYNTGYRSRG